MFSELAASVYTGSMASSGGDSVGSRAPSSASSDTDNESKSEYRWADNH